MAGKVRTETSIGSEAKIMGAQNLRALDFGELL